MRRTLQITTLVALVCCSSRAMAGGLSGDEFDWLFVRPFVGYEVAHIGAASVTGSTGETTVHGLAFGGEAGLRLGPFTFAALYQRTEALDDANKGANLNKLYGEFAVNIRSGFMNGVLSAAFGWAMIGAASSQTNGFGGKFGAGLDFYLADWVSIGPGAAFDLQGYILPNGVIGGYGGTFVARVGFYL